MSEPEQPFFSPHQMVGIRRWYADVSAGLDDLAAEHRGDIADTYAAGGVVDSAAQAALLTERLNKNMEPGRLAELLGVAMQRMAETQKAPRQP